MGFEASVRRAIGVRATCVAVGAFGLVAFAACGSAVDDGEIAGNAGGGAIGQGASGGFGNSGTGMGGGLVFDAGSGSDGALDDSNACAAEYQQAELLPLDLYVMFDRSGSMGTGNKWPAATAALNAFVQDPQSAGIGVGLDFFPDDPECSIGTYSMPSVPISVLPANQGAIQSALANEGPGGGTPTFPAMQGALTYAQTHAIQNPDHVVVIVLATDGQPNDCFSNVSNVSQIAAQGLNANPKILTFVIGVGSSLSNLNAIAQAGGTGQAYIVDTAGNVTQQFIDALDAIRGAALACEYLIPTPSNGVVDPNKVNVEYTAGGGAPPVKWPKYPDQASCPTSGDGWYYDDPIAPTKIHLCPSSCSFVKQDAGGQVGVLFGCSSIGPS